MYIFDRWGHIIFETNSLNLGWDGKIKGDMVPVGTYVYLVKLKDYRGKEYHYDGHVSVIR
jgi:gliding motility-associated-like protein